MLQCIPIAELSAFNLKRFRTVAVTGKAYYDGSGKKDTQFLTLAGYAGTLPAWLQFEEAWAKVLERHNCSFLHMADAFFLRNEFSFANGWTHDKVNALLIDLLNECLSQTGWGDYRNEFVGVSSTVNLEDYHRACNDRPELKAKTPEEICVRLALRVALQVLPENKESEPFHKDGAVEIYFDENELFRSKIENEWRKYRNNRNTLWSLVASIGSVNHRQVIGVQAADFLAWQTNRSFTGNPDNDLRTAKPSAANAKILTLSCPRRSSYYDYEKLMKIIL